MNTKQQLEVIAKDLAETLTSGDAAKRKYIVETHVPWLLAKLHEAIQDKETLSRNMGVVLEEATNQIKAVEGAARKDVAELRESVRALRQDIESKKELLETTSAMLTELQVEKGRKR